MYLPARLGALYLQTLRLLSFHVTHRPPGTPFFWAGLFSFSGSSSSCCYSPNLAEGVFCEVPILHSPGHIGGVSSRAKATFGGERARI
jgi:hypothetical protein